MQHNKGHQPRLLKEAPKEHQRNDAQKAEYRERLRQYLQDPDFRQIEGFPLGSDEDILALSDPPYYTACPNPFLPEIIEQWQAERATLRGKLGLPDDADYHREPFSSDVSEGKSGAIYSAHSYHTKVPHKAIMRYILHYTDPGDIVFDGFCGTGMTGVAAQLCSDREEIKSLGYHINKDDFIFDLDNLQTPITKLGTRKTILNDLSPIATFIAYNYNTPVNVEKFEQKATQILKELEHELGWMYETWHPHCDSPNRRKTVIDYVVWSDVLICSTCSEEIIFINHVKPGSRKKKVICKECGTESLKNDLSLAYNVIFDENLGATHEVPKRVPIEIHYSIGKKKHKKNLDNVDRKILEQIETLPTPKPFPINAMPNMQMMRVGRMKPVKITHLHHFFLPRPRHILSYLWRSVSAITDKRLKAFLFFTVEQAIWGMSLLNRYAPTHYSQVNRYLSGVYFVSSQISEVSPWYILEGKVHRLTQAFKQTREFSNASLVSTVSASAINKQINEFVDYIFVDPPFGENIYYADLNYLLESWHKVYTNSSPEAIIDRVKNKTLFDYKTMMHQSFKKFYSMLKPGRWITVEFHNSQNTVWNAIQEALLLAGFVVADVRILDKKQGSFQQINSASSTKQDLIISAYKPRTEFEQRFLKEAGTEAGAWEFVRQHLGQLPVAVTNEGVIEILSERQDYLLFDRMVAFHIQRGASVPLSASQFYAGLRQRFIERDSMFFLPEQAPAYDKARLEAASVAQLSLFVTDEKSSIQWLRQQLAPEFGGFPQTYQEIQPQFLKQLHQLKHEALPELGDILEQNFLQDDQGRWYMPDPNKASDLEKLRQKALLREFNDYRTGKKKLRQFRTEAIRAGFAHAWANKEYAAIVRVAERLPDKVLQEDPDLLMYYDNASLLM